MATDIATLGMEVDTSGLDRGAAATRRFRSESDRAANSADQFGSRSTKGFKAAGEAAQLLRNALLGVGSALAFREIVRQTRDQEDAMMALNVISRNVGKSLEYTTGELSEMANQMQRTTRFSDDAVMGAQAVFAAMNLGSKRVLPDLINVSADLATFWKSDLRGSAETLAKALKDPEQGLMLLNRQLRLFRDDETKVLKAWADQGKQAQVTDIVLGKLKGTFQGLSQEAGQNFGGALDRVKNAFGDLLEGDKIASSTAQLDQLSKTLASPEIKAGMTTFTDSMIGAFGYMIEKMNDAIRLLRQGAEIVAKIQTGSDVETSDPDIMRKFGRGALNVVGSPLTAASWTGQRLGNGLRSTLGGDTYYTDNPWVGDMLLPESGDGDVRAAAAAKAMTDIQASISKLTEPMNILLQATSEYSIFLGDNTKATYEWQQAQLAAAAAIEHNREANEKANKEKERQAALDEQRRAELDPLGGAADSYRKDVDDAQKLFADDPERMANAFAIAAEKLAAAQDSFEDILGGPDMQNTLSQFEQLLGVIAELEHTVVGMNSKWAKGTTQILHGIDRGAKAYADLNKARKAGDKDAMASAERSAMGAFGAMAEGASSYFDESSKGFKVLSSVSKAFHAAELAMTIAELVPKAISAVLTQGEGDPYTAPGRMAAMAAIVAGLGVAVGVSGGGGGGGGGKPQTSTGKGTVLGQPDELSKSISKAMDALISIEDAGLEVNRMMLVQLRSIDGALRRVGTALVRNFAISGNATPFGDVGGDRAFLGNATGEVGSAVVDGMTLGLGHMNIPVISEIANVVTDFVGNVTNEIARGVYHSKKKVTSAGLNFDSDQTIGDIMAAGIDAEYYQTIKKTSRALGVKTSSSTSTKYSDMDEGMLRQLSGVVSGLGEGVLSAIATLGGDVEAAAALLADMELGIDKINLKGLSAEEIQERLTAVFSALGDQMAELVAVTFDPELLVKYQQVGEGALETLTRVAAQTSAITIALEGMGFAIAGIDMITMVDVGQQLIELAGGLEAFGQNLNNFVDRFYTDEQKAILQRDRIQRQFTAMGLALPATREAFKDLVIGLDLTTESGRETFTVLTGISEMADEFYSVVEDSAKAANEALSDLRKTIEQARFGNLLPEAQLDTLMLQFTSAIQSAQDATGTDLLTRANAVNDMIRPLLDAIENVYATGDDAQALREYVLTSAEGIADRLEGGAGAVMVVQVQGSEEQLEQLQNVNANLEEIIQQQAESQAQMQQELHEMNERLTEVSSGVRLGTQVVP